jgi:hypothetical protein
MHEIAIATDDLSPRPPNMPDVDYDKIQIHRLEKVVYDYLKTQTNIKMPDLDSENI